MSAIQNILEQFPPVSVNNSREIIRQKLEQFIKMPWTRTAWELEQMGIDIDFPTGNPYKGYRFQNLESTPEYHNTNIY